MPTNEEAKVVDAVADVFDLLPFADRMAANPEGHVYLDLVERTAHDALIWAYKTYGHIGDVVGIIP